MTAYSLAVQADVRKRMSPPNRQDVPQISKELGIHQSTLYKWRSNWRLQGEVLWWVWVRLFLPPQQARERHLGSS